MDKSYIGLFKSDKDTWATQYDSIDDMRRCLVGECMISYNQFDTFIRNQSIVIGNMTVKYIVANKYKRRDL